MSIEWSEVRSHFRKCQVLNLQHAIASVDDRGRPKITPIGTIFLNSDQTGFFFEEYASSLAKYKEINPNIALLAVNTGKLYWLKSLFFGRFKGTPAIKVYGRLGERRKATADELKRLDRRLGFGKRLKGYDLLWQDMTMVRELIFDEFEIVQFGKRMPVMV